MTDKRVETIAKAIMRVDLERHLEEVNGDKNRIEGTINTMWHAFIPEAQAAISADPVTEDVKRLVLMVSQIFDAHSNGIFELPHGLADRVENELKKWSGE